VAKIDRALVVGAGICGLGVGIALARQGIDTEVVEIKSGPNVFGVGINQPGNSLRAMKKIGIYEQVRYAGFEIGRLDFNDADGNLIVQVPYHLAGGGVPHAIGIPRPELHRILIEASEAEGVRLTFGVSVDQLAEDGDRARVTLTDRREETFDLVVGADGVNSTIREQIFGDAYPPQFTGAGSWRLTVPRPDWVDSIGLFQGTDGKAGYIPLTQETMYVLLVRPEKWPARFDKDALPQMFRERLAPFGGHIAAIREAITDEDDVVYGPLHEVKVPLPWNRGPVVLCGDAVHACTPQMTQGAGMAFEDAVVLAEEVAVDRPVADSLQAFGERRYPRTKFVQDASRAMLDVESSITEENRDQSFEEWREFLPARSVEVDAILAQVP